MDPNTNLKEFLTILAKPRQAPADRARASELLKALAEWIDGGAFLPDYPFPYVRNCHKS